MIYDVLIVGAGPAGSYAARLLAQQGLAVALIDKAQFPRDKVCGGGLSRKSMDLLGFDLEPVMHERITGGMVTLGNEGALDRGFGTTAGCTVMREEFDALLLSRAQEVGVRFLAPSRFEDATTETEGVRVRTSSGELRARYLLAADGVGSAVRRRFFGRDLVTYAPALEALVRVPERSREPFVHRILLDFAGMPHGYGWIFPKRNHLNVGVYSIFGSRHLRDHLQRFIARYACLSESRQLHCWGAAIPLRNRHAVFEHGRIWLLGDAAGCAESVYGEGIYFALKTASLAAQTFADASGSPVAGAYTKCMRSDLVPELRLSETIGRAIYRVPKLILRRMLEDRGVSNDFVGLLMGTTTYRQCLLRTLRTMPRWLLRSDLRMAPSRRY